MSTVYKKFTPQDYAVVPFNAHKQYNFVSSSASSNSVNHYATQWTSESVDLHTSGNVKYNQIDHIYYRNFKKIDNISSGDQYFGQDDLNYLKHKRVLYENANILSIPTGLYGAEIRPTSLYIKSDNTEIIDDGYGNLILNSTNIENYETDIRSNVLNIGPVNGFKRYDLNVHDGYIVDGIDQYFYLDGVRKVNPISSYSTPEGDEYDDSYFFNLLQYKNVNFSEQSLNSGNFPCIDFTSASFSSVRIGHKGDFNFNPGDNFTISFWAKINHGATATAYLVSKSTIKEANPGNLPELHNSASNPYNIPYEVEAEPQFPFEIYAIGNKIYFSRSDGDTTTTINGTFTLNTMTHFTCRVKDGTMAIFKNGSSLTTGTDNTTKQTQNTANVYIGSKGGNLNNLNGSMSQINIFTKALTDTQVNNHYLSSNGSPYIGNIFYKNGFINITHPKYINALDTTGGGVIHTLQFQGSHQIYEHEYQCTIGEHEYNNTTNISARKIKSINEEEIAGFQTSSAFKPYITTIGLYNENNELLVVGKMAQPVKRSNETDTTIVLRWDT
tara:strand:- start:2 stop:1666 length:1665 start_codon:yes stop_codon:yes gene_type:complete